MSNADEDDQQRLIALQVWRGCMIATSWITTRNQKIERQHQRIREQLSNFYSVLIGMHKQILEKSQVRVKLRGIANRAYENELRQASDDPEEKKRIAFASGPAYEKLMEYDNQQLTGELVPLYRSMLDHVTKNMWLAEPSTLEHYPALVEYVELWNRGLKQTLPTEVMFEVKHEEKKLDPFYADLDLQFKRLRDELKK